MWQHPLLRYKSQMEKTRDAVRQVNQELENLRLAHPNQPPADCKDDELNAAYKKIMFISAQVTTAQTFFKNMIAQDAVFETRDFLKAPTSDEEKERREFYNVAADLLEVFEASFLATLHVRNALFVPIFDEFMTILQTHPELVKDVTVLGALSGGAYGAGVHHMLAIKHIFPLGLHTWLKVTFGKVGAVIVGGIAGAAVGFFVICVAVGIYVAAQALTYQRPSHDVKRQEMMAEIDRVSKLELSVETLKELQELFTEVFLRPVVPIGDDACPICFGSFQVDNDNESQPVTVAIGCSSNHFVHRRCERAWLTSSQGDIRCVLCRK